MPLTGQDFLPKKGHDAYAELERAMTQPEHWRHRFLATTTKLALQNSAFDDRLVAEPDATPETRARWREELGLEALRLEQRDLETLIRRAPESIARAQKRFRAVLADEGQAAIARLDTAARLLWKRAFHTAPVDVDELREEFRPLIGLAMQWANILQANSIPVPEHNVPVAGAVASRQAFHSYLSAHWLRLENL